MPVMTLPAEWMPAAKARGIVVHWTAGLHTATALDREHYHVMIEADGSLVRGRHTIADNDSTTDGVYAAHTRGHNTGIIGVSLCCMGDDRNPSRVRESPFVPGPYPMTRMQWDALPAVLAALCRRYGIAVTPQTVLSHAEVQGTLGIAQKGKWDIARLAFDPTVVGAKACGDIFRSRTAALLAPKPKPKPTPPPEPVRPARLVEATPRSPKPAPPAGFFTRISRALARHLNGA